MVVQQDNTRPSTSLNAFIDKASPETISQRTRVERLVPLQTHTAATHISADNKHSPAIKTAKSTKTRHMLLSDSPAKTAKTSINIAFLSPFHVKHRLKSHISTPLNPSALPHDRRRSKVKSIWGSASMRLSFSRVPSFAGLHKERRSLLFRVDLNTLTRSR